MENLYNHIVKVQRPIITSEPDIIWLIYGEGRSNVRHIRQAEVPPSLRDAMGVSLKAFFLANWNIESNTWTLGPRTDEQDW